MKNQITIILFKRWPTNSVSKAKSCNFHFHKNDVTWPLSASGLWSLCSLSNYIQIQDVNCWLANSTWHISNTTICVQPCSVNVFSRMFIFQTKLGVMRLHKDTGAKIKQILTILSHWNIGGSSFHCQRSYIFLQCEWSACET